MHSTAETPHTGLEYARLPMTSMLCVASLAPTSAADKTKVEFGSISVQFVATIGATPDAEPGMETSPLIVNTASVSTVTVWLATRVRLVAVPETKVQAVAPFGCGSPQGQGCKGE